MSSTNTSSASKFQPFHQPVNLIPPNENDRYIDSTLAQYMEKEMKMASDEEMRRRDAILSEVKQIFLRWVQFVAVTVFKMTEEEAEDAGGDIFISGSHRLGVRDIGADIDTVCIAPNFCTREHFFTYLKEDFLRHSDVTDLIAIEGAIVPVLSFDFRKVSIDLLFARLADNVVPKDLDILDDRILVGLDLPSERSLNGPRVTNMVPKLVGEKSLPNFRIVLRCIRKWAKNRGIYGNKLGYLGGVNCNLLVAFVCQLYPNASPSKLLSRFFLLYKDWQWPKPVKLNQIQPNPPGENREIWNERDNIYHVMPIITPAYPAMNSTANVSPHSLEVMKREFQIGYEVIMQIINEKGKNWERLFAPSDFFIRYQHYLCCHIVAPDDDEASRSWIGFVESRIRHITSTKYLSTLPLLKPIHLHPVVSKTQKSVNSVCYFIGFNVDPKCKALYLEDCINRYIEGLHDPERGFKNLTKKEGLEFYVEHYPWKRLPPEVFTSLGGRDVAKAMRLAQAKKLDGDGSMEKSVDKTIEKSTDKTTEQSISQQKGMDTKVLDMTSSQIMQIDGNDAIESKTEEIPSTNIESKDTIMSAKKRLYSETDETDDKGIDKQSIARMKLPQYFGTNLPKLTNRRFIVPNFTWANLDTKNDPVNMAK